jgi:hypothetical protein
MGESAQYLGFAELLNINLAQIDYIIAIAQLRLRQSTTKVEKCSWYEIKQKKVYPYQMSFIHRWLWSSLSLIEKARVQTKFLSEIIVVLTAPKRDLAATTRYRNEKTASAEFDCPFALGPFCCSFDHNVHTRQDSDVEYIGKYLG